MGLIAVADLDLPIKGGRSSRPLDKGEGGGGGLKNFFPTFQASVWSKNNGEARPLGPIPWTRL